MRARSFPWAAGAVAATLFTSSAAPAAREALFEVAPRPLEWQALGADTFDPAWRLPETRRAGGRDLLPEMQRLAEARFTLDGQPAALGDLVVEARDLSPAARRTWFAGLARRAPEFVRDWGAGVEQLLFDDQLLGRNWDTESDHSADGILTAEPWDLAAEGAPWDRAKPRRYVQQGATLIPACTLHFKQAENAYDLYLADVDTSLTAIAPMRGGHWRGRDPEGRDFAAVRVTYSSDLPFPFGGLGCDLRILSRIDDQGRLVTDIHGVTRDFHFLSGRDIVLPVETAAGATVSLLVVRYYGFDLRGVPDKPKHHRQGLRASLGNLKRRALEFERAADEHTWDAEVSVPEFPVRGRR